MANNETLKDLIQVIKFKRRLRQKDIASQIGVKDTYLSGVINGKFPYSESLERKIYELYSDCFPSQKARDNSIQQSATGENISQSVDDPNTSRFLALLEKRDEQMDKLIENQREERLKLLEVIANLSKQ